MHGTTPAEIRLGDVLAVEPGATGSDSGSRVAGAAKGAAKGAGIGLACLGGLSHSGSCSGAFCGAVDFIILATCGVVTVAGVTVGAVGGAVGAGNQQSADTPAPLSTARVNGPQELGEAYIQFALRNAVENCLLHDSPASIVKINETANDGRLTDEGKKYLTSLGAQTILTTSLDAIRLVEAPNGQRRIAMHATVIGSRLADGTRLGSARFSFASEARPLRDWSQNNAQPLLEALQQGYASLSTQICHALIQDHAGI